jgi:hypothetical protein
VKTPLKPGLDDEIYEVEERISRRRAELPRVARATGRSALHALASPAGLAVAAALGFLVGGGLRRNGSSRKSEVSKEEKSRSIAIGSLLMSGAIALIRAQFGSPLGMAQAVLEKIQSRKAAVPPAQARTSPRGDRRSVAG